MKIAWLYAGISLNPQISRYLRDKEGTLSYFHTLFKILGIIISSLIYLSSVVVFAANDWAVWTVTAKACNAQPKAVSGKETLQLASGLLAHVYLSSEQATTECYSVEAFMRIASSLNRQNGIYSETSHLQPQALRTVCRNKSDGSVISDTSAALNAPEQSLTLTTDGDLGLADIVGSPECKSGALHFALKKN